MKATWTVLGLAAALSLSGCAMVSTPVNGAWYTDVQYPSWASSNAKAAGPKNGEASAQSVLGLVATGDASIKAACANGGITTIHTVDHAGFSVLGLFSKFTTRVTGE